MEEIEVLSSNYDNNISDYDYAVMDSNAYSSVSDQSMSEQYEGNAASSNGGNLHIMIIVISVCVILGIVLGIIAGRKAAK